MPILDESIQALADMLIFELSKAMALPPTRQVLQTTRLLFGKAARRFSELAVGLDRAIAEQGTAGGARWILPSFTKAYTARGVENIPSSGPLIISSNHPGAFDSVVISAHVARPDYKIIIGDIPFFEHLPHVSEHAIFAPKPDNVTGRMEVVRKAIRHLRAGGALLIFARGGIEPDPSFMPEPGAEFNLWSRSLQIFLEHVPQAQVLVSIVSGVIARAAMSHPITRLRRTRPDRQRLAFMIQMARQALSGRETYGLTPRVSFGRLIDRYKFNEPRHALEAIQQSARHLLESHLAWHP